MKSTVMLQPSDSLDTSLNIVGSLIEAKEDGSSAVVVANTGESVTERYGLRSSCWSRVCHC